MPHVYPAALSLIHSYCAFPSAPTMRHCCRQSEEVKSKAGQSHLGARRNVANTLCSADRVSYFQLPNSTYPQYRIFFSRHSQFGNGYDMTGFGEPR